MSVLSPDTGFPYIIVQHLFPDYKSPLCEILSKYTDMSVIQAEDGMAVMPDNKYIITPGKVMRIEGGMLRLTDRSSKTLSLPVDTFIRSLAVDAGSRAVAIVLCDTGSGVMKGISAGITDSSDKQNKLPALAEPHTGGLDMARRSILIVDDNEIELRILSEAFNMDYTVFQAKDGREAIATLMHQYKVISAVLLDIVMPVMDGFEVLKAMRSNPSLSQIPVIVITGETDRETQKRALQSGATDFAPKPFDCEILRLRVANLIRLRENAALSNALKKDRLTGLLTRDAFLAQVERIVSSKKSGTYIMSAFDIDKFTAINDQYGTAKGDEVLKFVAEIIQNTIRALGGCCARMNDDNFALLFPAAMADSNVVAESHFTATNGRVGIPPIQFSIGRYIIDDITVPAAIMYDRALMAKSTVKGHYENHIATYNESMRQGLLLHQRISDDMKPALANNQFEAWFQPQYNNLSGALIGAEALARWRHPERGMVSPAEFIPVFENNGFIYELDKNIWEQTCAFLRRCLDEGAETLPISVNVSRYDIVRDDLCDVLLALLEKYRLPAELLRLEVTESAFSGDANAIINMVKKLVDLGFTVEIDDFGSGYSSLNTLKDVPAQIIKLDMRFLEASNNLERGGSIIESIIRMARWLGMAVIAEGVETLEQARYLRSVGCSYSQGWLFGKAMTADDYAILLKNADREKTLTALRTVENLDNNAFWDPASMDSLIFNSYVGAACILEFTKGQIHTTRVTDTFIKVMEELGLSHDDLMKLDWAKHLTTQGLCLFSDGLMESLETRETVKRQYEFHNLPGCPEKVYLRCFHRVIVSVGDRYMVYSINENITQQMIAEQQMAQAERKEQETNERMRAVMAGINGGVSAAISVDGKSELLFANDRFYSILGYTKEQFEAELPNGLHDLLLPADSAAAENSYFAHMTEGGTTSNEFRVVKRDGSIIWLHAQGSTCHFESINELVNLAVYTDITAEKLIAQKAADAERLQAIMRNVNGGMAVMTVTDGKPEYIFYNDQYCAMFGYTREQFEQEAPFGLNTLIPPEHEKRVAAIARASERAWKDSVVEFPVLCRGGKTVWVRAHNSVNSMESYDKPVHISILDDITIERESQQRIEALSRNLQSMMADIPGGYARIRVMPDGKLKLVFLNAGFYRLVGMTKEQVDSRSGGDPKWGIHPDDEEKLDAAVAEMINTGECRNASYRLINGGEGYTWVSIFGRSSLDENGNMFLNIYYSEPDQQKLKDLELRETMPFLLSATMQTSTDIVFAKDTNFRYICGSPAFVRFTKTKSADDIIGKTDFDLFPHEVAENYRLVDEELLFHNVPIVDRLEPIHSDDDFQHFASISKYVLRDSAGEILAIYGIGRDVTDVRQAYSRLTLLNETIPGGIASYVMTPNDITISYFNDGFCKMLGCTREEYNLFVTRQNSVMSMVHPEDIPGLMAQVTRLRLHDEPLDYNYRCRKLDGSGWVWINIRANATERRGDAVYANAALFDITAQRTAISRLQLLTDSIPGGLVTVDYSAKSVSIVYYSDGFCKMLGYTREEYDALDKSSEGNAVCSEDKAELYNAIKTLAHEGVPVDCTFRINTKSGKEKWVSFRSGSAEQFGDTCRFNAVLYDMSDFRSSAEAIRRLELIG